MSLPNIPDFNSNISITRPNVLNLLLASIALEEIALAHVINSEAEKLQSIVIPTTNIPNINLEGLIAINSSVNDLLSIVIKKEMLLQLKLEDIIDIPPCQVLLTNRVILTTMPGSSEQRFFGIAQGIELVLVEVLVNGTAVNSITVPVILNRFAAELTVPEGLPPNNIITIRVQSVSTPSCSNEQNINQIPILNP